MTDTTQGPPGGGGGGPSLPSPDSASASSGCPSRIQRSRSIVSSIASRASRAARRASLISFLLFMTATPLYGQTNCKQYTARVGEAKHRLAAMPSRTREERLVKRDSARALIVYIKDVKPCDYLLAWSRIILLQAYMESLWPDLSEAWEFAEAVREFHKSYPLIEDKDRGQYWEWLGRVYLDYALFEALEGLEEPKSSKHYRRSLSAYRRAEAIYGARRDLPGWDAVTYYQIRGYMGEAMEAGGDSLPALCRYAEAMVRAPGLSDKVRVFRQKMLARFEALTSQGFDPSQCRDGEVMQRGGGGTVGWAVLVVTFLIIITLVAHTIGRFS